VQADELRAWMPQHDVPASLLKFPVCREIPAIERPVRVGMQLLPPFVKTVHWKEERLWIRRMNRHRHVKRSGSIPHCVKAPVVDAHELPCRDVLAKIEAEGF
jgi:hypothetical protein